MPPPIIRSWPPSSKSIFAKPICPSATSACSSSSRNSALFPWLLVETDIKRLREVGFSDAEILHIIMGSAHFNYLNRMADGIGIQFEYKTDIVEFKVPSQGSERGSAGDTAAPGERSSSTGAKSTAAWIGFPEVGHPSRQEAEPLHLFEVIGRESTCARPGEGMASLPAGGHLSSGRPNESSSGAVHLGLESLRLQCLLVWKGSARPGGPRRRIPAACHGKASGPTHAARCVGL